LDEEVVLLEEQLASAHADIERLQTRLAEADAAQARSAAEAETQRLELESLREELSTAAEQAKWTAQRYRDAVLAGEPDLLAELVSGDTIAEIDASVAQARQTVAQIRQHLEQQAKALRVPAGAPARSAPDFSALSPAEKIRLGLEQR
jgi:chromosome segregation ATPase